MTTATKQVPEQTISDECKWCASEGLPEWSEDAQCWIHRRPSIDKKCLRKTLSPHISKGNGINQAAKWLQQGKAVRRASWINSDYALTIEGMDTNSTIRVKGDPFSEHAGFDVSDLLANDWEIQK